MADKDSKHPSGSLMQYPDHSQYLYMECGDDLTQGTYVEISPMGRFIRFKGGLRFPSAIIMETVSKGHYTWAMVRPPQQEPKSPIVVPEPVVGKEPILG